MAKMTKKQRELDRAARAKALRAEQERAERLRRYGVIGAVVVAIALIAAALVWSTRGGDPDITVNTSLPASVGENSLKVGPDDAEHTVVVWEDFLCPYCREFEEGSRDLLHAAAEEGTVQVEYRPFQLLGDDYSKEALAAFVHVLETGTPQEAAAFHDLLFKNQPYEAGRKPSADKIAGWAEQVGADKEATRKAIEDGKADWSAAAKQAAEEAGVNGTPTVTLDGQPLQGNSISDMIANLEAGIA
jgi:protein-disulfide isomerase